MSPTLIVNKTHICEIHVDGSFPKVRLFCDKSSLHGTREFLELVREYYESIDANIMETDGEPINLDYAYQKEFENRQHRIESKVSPMISDLAKLPTIPEKTGIWRQE